MATDPLDVLRRPDEPVSPRPGFAADLRRRLAAALDPPAPPDPTPDPGSTAMSATRPLTATALAPYLIVHDAAAALAFYADGFGAAVTLRIDQPDGRIGHAELDLDGVGWKLADEFPEYGTVGPRTLGGTPVTLYLDVADVDAAFARVVAAGATVERPPADQFHGNRNAVVIDPFGHRWMLSTAVEAVTVAEMQRRNLDPGGA